MRDRLAFAALCTLAIGTLGITGAVKYLIHTEQLERRPLEKGSMSLFGGERRQGERKF